MSEVEVITYSAGPMRFTMGGQPLGRHLYTAPNKVTPGMVKRLVDYASRRLADYGFEVAGWVVLVELIDEDARAREFTVRFTSVKGGQLGVQRIWTNRGGWPWLDHGFFVDTKR